MAALAVNVLSARGTNLLQGTGTSVMATGQEQELLILNAVLLEVTTGRNVSGYPSQDGMEVRLVITSCNVQTMAG